LENMLHIFLENMLHIFLENMLHIFLQQMQKFHLFVQSVQQKRKRKSSDSSSSSRDHYTPKQIANFYLEVVDEEDPSGFWKCRGDCGDLVKKSNSGWGNLHLHVVRKHPNHIEEMDDARAQKLWCPTKGYQVDRAQVPITSFMPKGAQKVYGWLDWVITNLFPFSFVENEKNREYSNLEKTDRKTFMKYMFAVVKRVEDKIAKEMPQKIGLLFDAWTENRYLWVGLFAIGGGTATSKRWKRLISFTVMTMDHVIQTKFEDDAKTFLTDEDESSGMKFDSSAYVALFSEVLGFYNKDLSDVILIVGDNCSTNKKIANDMNCCFLGCLSHRLNLAVKKYLIQHKSILEKLESLCKKLRSLKHSAELREITSVMPALNCETRWSGIFKDGVKLC